MGFCVLRRNSRWPPKVVGKHFFQIVASRLGLYPVGKKFRRNRSISFCFQDKRVFAFYTKIQDDRQKWRENDFWKKSDYTLWVKYFVKIALCHSISEINAVLLFQG